MDTFKVNFRCPVTTVEVIDKLAAADHRDRTSMLNKIVDFYLSHNGHKPNTTPAPKKKAGTR